MPPQNHRNAEAVISNPGCSPLGACAFLSGKRHLPFGDLLFGSVTPENFPERPWRRAPCSITALEAGSLLSNRSGGGLPALWDFLCFPTQIPVTRMMSCPIPDEAHYGRLHPSSGTPEWTNEPLLRNSNPRSKRKHKVFVC